ncbi:MAG: helix-turn-helix domain-containing protein [Sciscionella sp.]
MLTLTELTEIASAARRSLFRLETLDRYEVPIDGSDLSVYLAGGEQPHNAAKLAWQEHLRAERASPETQEDRLSQPARRPDELSTTLRQLRSDADLPGMEAARRAGYSQPKISRFETARQVPTTEEVRTLCQVYGAPPEVRDRLLELASDLTGGTVRSRAVLSHGARYMQQRVGKIEQASELVRSFTPTWWMGYYRPRTTCAPWAHTG